MAIKSTKTTKGKSAKTSKKSSEPKISIHSKPGNMTDREWQIALRRQIAAKETFVISEYDMNDYPGYYSVVNPKTRNTYRVVYRGIKSQWNYCSCMDFKTNQLGTCKHIEAVRQWIENNGKRIHAKRPSYSSLTVSYQGDRHLRLRIGSDHAEEIKKLSKDYFDKDGILLPEAMPRIYDFMAKARKINDTFRWFPDVTDFIAEQRDYKMRQAMLATYTDEDMNSLLKTDLYPYQKEGIRFSFTAGKSIIADEMGLGKTLQAIGTAELMKKNNLVSSVMIVCPTSLKYQWKKEIERFTDSSVIVIEGNHLVRKAQYKAEEFYKIVSYNCISNDIKILRTLRTDMLIMDEVQRLKNWNTQVSQAARRIESDYAVVLSGTPLENKLEELYSIMQFVDQYRLGPYYKFMQESVVRTETGKVIGYKNLNNIGERLKPVLIRRRKRDVALQLPERMDKTLFVPMTKEQKEIHDEFQMSVSLLVARWNRMHFLSDSDRKRLLLLLSQMRMVCDSTFILDQKSRYDTKVDETMDILNTVFESCDEKVVIFSQWERMTRLIASELEKRGIKYEYLHGGVPSAKRKDLTDNFTNDPESRVFISTDAGSTGLNLQVASIIINIDIPWNPAILEQRIARIYRIGQKRNIQVINLVASGTIEERMLSTLNFKTKLFDGILDNGEDAFMLDDSNLEKIMNTIQVMTKETDSDSGIIEINDSEPVRNVEPATESEGNSISGITETDVIEPELFPEDEETTEEGTIDSQQIIQQGITFISGLARILQSPEETQKMVDNLVVKDKETGKTHIKIPVQDKETVLNVINSIAQLFQKTPTR